MHVHASVEEVEILKKAAAIMLHWERADVEAVCIMLEGVTSIDDAHDVIMGMLLLSKMTTRSLTAIVEAA